jgi:hypothetical protein
MEEQKKSREQELEEQVEKLQKENEQLSKGKAMYEDWWRQADAKNLELIEVIKSIGSIANIIYNSSKK